MITIKVLYSGHDILGENATAVGFRLKSTTNLRRALDDMSPEMEAARDIFFEMEREWFASHGAGSWAPLAESTLRYKARRGWPSDPLVRGDPVNTEDLRGSLTVPGHEYGTQKLGSHSLRFGTQVRYAAAHDRGFAHRGGGFVAARRPIPRRSEYPEPFRQIRAVIVDSLKRRVAG